MLAYSRCIRSWLRRFPRIQRALLLQGGGALGAYQAGVFKALYEKIRNDEGRNGDNDNEPLFDIIAGTSIGAINAAILVGYFLENKTWKGSAKRLEVFLEVFINAYTTNFRSIKPMEGRKGKRKSFSFLRGSS